MFLTSVRARACVCVCVGGGGGCLLRLLFFKFHCYIHIYVHNPCCTLWHGLFFIVKKGLEIKLKTKTNVFFVF